MQMSKEEKKKKKRQYFEEENAPSCYSSLVLFGEIREEKNEQFVKLSPVCSCFPIKGFFLKVFFFFSY